MPSSPSNSLRLEEQFTGEGINVWGVLLNQVIAMLDGSIAGMTTVALTGNRTLTATNYVADESRNAILKLTGSVASIVTIPAVTKIYLVWNASSAIQTIASSGGGSTLAIDPSDIVVAFCDAVNVKTLSYGGLSIKDYIIAAGASAGAVPSPLGNAGKALFTPDGTNVLWKLLASTDISDFTTKVKKRALIYSLVF